MSDHEQKIEIEFPDIEVTTKAADDAGGPSRGSSKASNARANTPKVQMTDTTRGFLGGLLLGTVGLKLLGSRDAKHLYARAIASGMRVKDSLDESVEDVRASYGDVMAEAEAIYARERSEAKAREYADLSGEEVDREVDEEVIAVEAKDEAAEAADDVTTQRSAAEAKAKAGTERGERHSKE